VVFLRNLNAKSFLKEFTSSKKPFSRGFQGPRDKMVRKQEDTQ